MEKLKDGKNLKKEVRKKLESMRPLVYTACEWKSTTKWKTSCWTWKSLSGRHIQDRKEGTIEVSVFIKIFWKKLKKNWKKMELNIVCHYSEESVHRVYGKAIVVIVVVVFFYSLISSLLNGLVWSHPLFQSTFKSVYTKKNLKFEM